VQKLAKDRSRITIASLAGSTELTGSACSPTGFQWSFDNYSNSVGLARELVSFHQDTWFFITADYAFGWSLEHEAGQAVIQAGGRVLGSSRHPLNERNFGSHLSLAQDSNAKVIALANAGGDTVETIRQAAEIGISPRTQTLVPMLVFISDVHKLGLDLTKGMTFVDGFYWDLDADTRSWSKRFQSSQHTMPTMATLARIRRSSTICGQLRQPEPTRRWRWRARCGKYRSTISLRATDVPGSTAAWSTTCIWCKSNTPTNRARPGTITSSFRRYREKRHSGRLSRVNARW
jgi:hypothetical protein